MSKPTVQNCPNCMGEYKCKPSCEAVAEYEARLQALEAEGLSRSDAQGVVDAEDLKAQADGRTE